MLEVQGGKDSYRYRLEKVGEPTQCNDPYLTKNNSDCWENLASNSKVIELDEGKWVVHVQKGDDCEKTETVTIQNHTAPHFEKIEQLLCEATADEVPVKITLSSPYKGIYYYSINGAAEKKVELSPESPSFIVKVAPNQSCKIRVRDDLRCEANDVISVKGFFTAEVDEKITRNCVTNADLSFKVRIVAQKGENDTERSFHYTLLAPDKTTTQGELKEGEHLVYFSGQVGHYQIRISDKDTEACPIVKNFIVEEAKLPNVEKLQIQDEQCQERGKISITMPKNYEGYTFEMVGAIDLATRDKIIYSSHPTTKDLLSASFENLRGSVAGIQYEVEIKDSYTGCATNLIAVVKAPKPIILPAQAMQMLPYTCNSTKEAPLAQLSVDEKQIQNGVAPYTFDWFNGYNHQLVGKGTSYLLPNLNGGKFYLKVTDANGCEAHSAMQTLTPTNVLTKVEVEVLNPINCQHNEEIIINAQVQNSSDDEVPAKVTLHYIVKGNNGYQFESKSTSEQSFRLEKGNALPVGVYTIEVVNEATGCSVKTTHTVKEPNTFALQVSDIERASCSEGKGKATLKLLNKTKGGFAGGFSYVVTSIANGAEVLRGNSQADTVTLYLVGGAYSVVVKEESLGCEVSTEVTIPKNPAPVKVSATAKTEADCTGANGSAEVYIQGGKSPYIVEVVNLRLSVTYRKTDLPAGVTAMTVPFNNLADGTYHVTVRDASGCAEATTQFVIAPYKSMEIANFEDSTSPITCFDSKDGRLNVSAILSGGVPPYRYILTNSIDSSVQPRTINANNGKATFENIGDGVYYLQILDSRDCTTEVIKTYSFSAPKPIKAEVDMENSVFHTCYAQRNGKIIVKNISGGTGSYKVYLITSDRKKVIDRKVGVKAGDTVEFTNIAPSQMSYEVALQDDNHCIKADLVTFRIEENPGVAMEYVERETFCDYQTESGYNDYLVVKFKNPTIDFSKVSYRLNQGNFKSFTRTLDNVAFIDDYDRSITVTQTIEISYGDPLAVNTCSVSEHNFALPVLLPYTLERIPNNELNIIEVLAKGGNTESKGYTYYFNGVNQGENPVYKVKNSDPERIESHGLRVKVVEVRVEDANGCPRTLIIEEPYSEIDVPNFFTPDGDGDNDYWRPGNLKNNPNAQIHIYDRNGRRMAILRPGQAWDGIYNGTPMPSGDYWYVIDLNDERNSEEGGKIYGHFSLYR